MHDADGQPLGGSLAVMTMKIMGTTLALFYLCHNIFLASGRRSSNEGVLLLLISMSARTTIGSFFDSIAANYVLLLFPFAPIAILLEGSVGCINMYCGNNRRTEKIWSYSRMVDVATSSEEEGCSERYLE